MGLNPALIYLGDLAIRNIVKAIQASSAWRYGNNAIVIVWGRKRLQRDADSASRAIPAAELNKVVLTVETNDGGHGVQSGEFYDSFSLLWSLEGGFGLPCLNHACDKGVNVMSDLFGGGQNEQ